MTEKAEEALQSARARLSPTLTRPARSNAEPMMTVRDVDFFYGDAQALFGVTMDLYPREVVAFMGPSGCGKTTLLKCFNRMFETIRDARLAGEIALEGEDIMAPHIDPPMLRRRFGWVAQSPNPFPTSVYDNIAYAARIHSLVEDKAGMDAHVESCLRRANLWDEVKDRLHEDAVGLSGGQQQRLCIARALSVRPEILLMDEPCSAIDPIATEKIEALIHELKEDYSVVIITHNLQQAARVADRVAFFKLGYLVEIGPADEVFQNPLHPETAAYLAGKFG